MDSSGPKNPSTKTTIDATTISVKATFLAAFNVLALAVLAACSGGGSAGGDHTGGGGQGVTPQPGGGAGGEVSVDAAPLGEGACA